MDDADVKRISQAFKALSNPNRLQLFLNLLEDSELDLAQGRVHDCFLTNILGNLRIGAPTVSHHVKELVNAGLIDTRREGKQLICTINPEALRALRSVFVAPGGVASADLGAPAGTSTA